ncbi:MAG TPA: Sec-independent protein translocase protein TatB [Stellaceae bacterium]|jgi:sec-independent protein translocase protein TatB|nr:Sec-independent protein translocase protein TatB [Stellaceae bacterium]
MLFDIGWPELMLIGVIALVVIGPKDLPRAMRVAGFWMRKARTLSREFQSSIDQMIREAELDEIRQEMKKATEINLDQEIGKTIDPTGSLAESMKPPELPDYFDPSSAEHPIAADEPAAAVPAPADAIHAENVVPEQGESPERGESKVPECVPEPAAEPANPPDAPRVHVPPEP